MLGGFCRFGLWARIKPLCISMDSTSPTRSRRKEKSKEPEEAISSATSQTSTSPQKSKDRPRSKSPRSKRSAVDSSALASSSAPIVCDWDSLPFDACLKILEYFTDDLPSLVSLGSVSSYWRRVSTSEPLWRQLFLRHFTRLEPSDEYFLQHGVPKPTLLREKTGGMATAGPSSYWHLFANKWPLLQYWYKGKATINTIKATTDIERFSMMVEWRGFCVTGGSDGRLCFWDPKQFRFQKAFAATKKKAKAEPKADPEIWREIKNLHEYHIWWMTIQGDLCFTVGSDGTLKVTDLAPLIDDPAAPLETIVVMSDHAPYWAIDVSLADRLVVIGSQVGYVTVLEWEKDDWRKWKMLRSVKLGAGVWDVCLLPQRRIAACGYKNISIYDFNPLPTELRQDEEDPATPVRNALIAQPKRHERLTIPAFSLPYVDHNVKATTAFPSPHGLYVAPQMRAEDAAAEAAVAANDPAPIVQQVRAVRNLNFTRGLLIAAVVGRGIEAWNVDTRELVWFIDTNSIDVFDIQQSNNKLVCVGTDVLIGYPVILTYDFQTQTLIRQVSPDGAIGRVFSACVTDDSIYVCAVDLALNISFSEKKDGIELEKKESSSCVVS